MGAACTDWTRFLTPANTSDEPLLSVSATDIRGWVAELRNVVERGTVDEKRALLRAWVKQIVAVGDDLTIEFTFPLVDSTGGGGSEATPTTISAVYNRSRVKVKKLGPKLRKGELAVRRVLPTVTNGADNRTRTCDPAVNSRLLYQLSYVGKAPAY